MTLLHLSRVLALIGLAWLGVSCTAAYRPQSSQTAKIRTKGDRLGLVHWNRVQLMAIEGKPTAMPVYIEQFYTVDAGQRSFVVRYEGNRTLGASYLESGPVIVTGHLQPLRKYEITGKFGETEVSLYIRDIETGKTVGPTVTAPIHYQQLRLNYIPVYVPSS